MNKTSGLTLIELLVTVAVVSILLAVGVPAYQRMTEDNRQVATINALAGSLNLARSEAVKQSRPITVCASIDGTTCSNSTDWTNGWIAFIDLDRDGSIGNNEALVARQGALGAGIQLRAIEFDDNTLLRFEPTGKLAVLGNLPNSDPDGTFILCDTRSSDATRARAVNVNARGQISLAQDIDNSGVRNDIEGNDITCP